MLEKVRDYIARHHMLLTGEPVIVGLSGGADSVALLTVLSELNGMSGGLNLRLKAVHVHHGLRQAEADRDAEFATALCRRLNVPLVLEYRDVAAYARERRISTEEAGRILRYEVFLREADAFGALKIALAHHKDDNAETILHHLLRGSGLKGLGGIKPVQNNRIRPLLCVGKSEIYQYLREREIKWCEDSSNASDGYTRNRIRNQVLPMLADTVNEHAIDHILNAGEIFAQADDYLKQTADKIWMLSGESGTGQARIPLTVLLEQAPIIRTYLFRHMLVLAAPEQRDVTFSHYRQMESLLLRDAPGCCHLPGGLVAERGYDSVWIGYEETDNPKQDGIWGENLQIQVFCWKKGMEIPKNQYTKWFDYDKIKGTLSARSRQPGDYFLLPDGGRKTVARYMIDEKIPVKQRNNLLVVAEHNHVLWIVGYRISEYYKITEDTNRILQVTFNEGENHGR